MFLGFDLGGSTVRCAIYDEQFTLVSRSIRHLRHPGVSYEKLTVTSIVAAIIETTDELLRTCETPGSSIRAIGVGFAGQVSSDAHTIHGAPNIVLGGIALADTLEQALSQSHVRAPVRIFNDVAAQLWAERHAGAVQAIDDILAVYVGTGVGGAIVSGGQLIQGAHGCAGEIGHTTMPENSDLCGCGKQGCLETIVGGPYLQAHGNSALGHTSQFHESLHSAKIDLPTLDHLYKQDINLARVWNHAADSLAIHISNACKLLDPAALIFGGGVLRVCPNFMVALEAAVRKRMWILASNAISYHHASLGDSSGCLGAVLLAAKRLSQEAQK